MSIRPRSTTASNLAHGAYHVQKLSTEGSRCEMKESGGRTREACALTVSKQRGAGDAAGVSRTKFENGRWQFGVLCSENLQVIGHLKSLFYCQYGKPWNHSVQTALLYSISLKFGFSRFWVNLSRALRRKGKRKERLFTALLTDAITHTSSGSIGT